MTYRTRFIPPRRRPPLLWPIKRCSAQNYARLLEIIEDHRHLPASYDQWCQAAEHDERYAKRLGHLPVPVEIDPQAYIAFCAAHGFDHRQNFLGRFVEFRVTGKLV